MPACILWVSGESFDVDAYLGSPGSLKSGFVFRKGELRRRGEKKIVYDSSGFNLVVSENEDFNIQIQDASKFINSHLIEFEKLRNGFGKETAMLFSFSKSYDLPSFPYARFPKAFVIEAAKFGFSLEVGMFPRLRETCERASPT